MYYQKKYSGLVRDFQKPWCQELKMKASIYDLTNKTNEYKKVIFDWSVGYFKNDTGGNVVRW